MQFTVEASKRNVSSQLGFCTTLNYFYCFIRNGWLDLCLDIISIEKLEIHYMHL